MDSSFRPLAIGTLVEAPLLQRPVRLIEKGKITIHYPSRLEAMALDPSKVVEREDRIYRAGQINLVVSIFKHVTVRVVKGEGEIIVSNNTARPALIRHAGLFMQKALGFRQSLEIHVSEDVNLRHCGLGSSSGNIAAVASAINELFSCPLDTSTLSKLCAQNHGEEIDGDNSHINPVQCLGGSIVAGNYRGGLMVLSGRATPIASIDIPSTLSVVIGVPNEYKHPDSAILIQQEVDNMEGFVKSGKVFADKIAYDLVHNVLPDLAHGSLKSCKELVYQYRWNMGSIKNCSFVLPRITTIAEDLRKYQTDDEIKIFSLSSVGPGFFALTDNPEKVVEDFKNLKMNTYITSVYNNTYVIEE